MINQLIKIFTILVLAAGIPSLSQAQQKTVITQISNPGRIFPSCELEESRQQLQQQFGPEKADQIIRLVKASGWPAPLNNVSSRLEESSQQAIKKYKVRTMAIIDARYCLVSISAADNPGMDASYFLPSGQLFYMFVGSDGIKNPVAPPLVKKKATAAPVKTKKTK
ncbi:hypothetical protein DBR32_10140 [Taibaiella sp. KBW10]|uniref:hypothetical protein n=1 Tax=Taibaiella sp. KBW10 TaxID=2153357 RepID=UPI000F5AC355|nr:hypothetical protein [Taibaiella sp. KBW10]RQO31056.1 hypothetical protein DBR32_10140 [Taibaiella sp. KBW10]